MLRHCLRQAKRAIHKATEPNPAPLEHVTSERRRLEALPRHAETITDLPGFNFRIPDAASFLESWKEIFEQEIYKFKPINGEPRILDCGANVGVSCLYFYRQFPTARITAFEPDPKVFLYLQSNLRTAGCDNIELIPKGVWSSETNLRFQSEGANAGRICGGEGSNVIEIATVRLREFLNEPVDMLKMDVEGAETEVLADSASHLKNVKNIFVEYHSFARQPQSLARLVQILGDADFRVHIHPMNVAHRPFIQVDQHLGMDMQLNIFGFRT